MNTKIAWGEPIEAGSHAWPDRTERPAWLTDPIGPMQYRTNGSVAWQWYGYKPGWGFGMVGAAFRLPADHWAYAPIAAGYTPWAGTESAPDDLSDEPENVMLRGGRLTHAQTQDINWHHGAARTPEWPRSLDIIGYKRKQTAVCSVPAQPHTELTAINSILNRLAVYYGQTVTTDGTLPEQIEQLDKLLSRMQWIKPDATGGPDWYTPEGSPPGTSLHVPTIRACIAVMRTESGVFKLEALLPPDPLIERAKQLHAAARVAYDTTGPNVPAIGNADWSELSDALRKFWIAMARIDGERE
jgi:hypothetical protein